MLRVFAILVNFVMPGLGSLIIGKVWHGTAQILLVLLALYTMFIIPDGATNYSERLYGGFLFLLAVWLWSVITAARTPIQAPSVGGDDAGLR